MSRDRYTHTEADAAAYERATSDDFDWDAPTLADLIEDEQAEYERGRRGY